jgi:hypothetical protein
VHRILLCIAATAALFATSARADSITSINGISMTSTNEGSVTSSGSFGRAAITGGRNNAIVVTSTGAAGNVLIADPNPDSNNSIGVSSITVTNKATGTVTATGSFGGGNLASSNSNGNSMGVSAAGTSVNITINKK